ncbi:MAG TPA: ATP-binding protein [Terriglobia bacterium]|jgi:two-component system OmpR family sensor kinase|nr:ATP-binding protein [Terriglobia bacterium]
MKRALSLRSRMMLLFALVVGVLLAACSLGSYALLSHQLRSRLDQELAATAGPVTADLATDMDGQDVNELKIPEQYFELLDPAGHVLQRSENLASGPLNIGPKPLDPARKQFRTLQDLRYGRLRLVLAPFSQGANPRLLGIAMSTGRVDQVLALYREAVLVFLPLSLLLTALLSAWYVGRSLRPLADLTARASDMADRVASAGGAGGKPLWSPLPAGNTSDEIGRLSQTFNRLAERVEAALAQLRQFVTDASHQLRTPLTVLHGETELALAEPRSPAYYQRTLRLLEDELAKLSSMVEGLFTLSMADAGQLRLARDPLYLDEVLEESCLLVTPLAQAKGVKLERQLIRDVAYRGDEIFLQQLFLIFLDNALKYSPASTVITIRLERQNGHLRAGFSDQGPGIAPEHLPHIFKRFFRVPREGADESHSGGLGLAIARAIAESQGGQIECRSTPGHGSTFTITLPLDNEG